MPWLMKTLDHHTLGASPGTTSVNDFFRKRDRLKRSRARTSIKSRQPIAEQRLRLDNQAALR